MLRGGDILDILELHREGLGIREIHRRPGISRNSIKKALSQQRLWTYKNRLSVGSNLDAKALDPLRRPHARGGKPGRVDSLWCLPSPNVLP